MTPDDKLVPIKNKIIIYVYQQNISFIFYIFKIEYKKHLLYLFYYFIISFLPSAYSNWIKIVWFFWNLIKFYINNLLIISIDNFFTNLKTAKSKTINKKCSCNHYPKSSKKDFVSFFELLLGAMNWVFIFRLLQLICL